jgi:translation elongation factor EF-Ts
LKSIAKLTFVTKNDSFLALANAAAALIAKHNPADLAGAGCLCLRARRALARRWKMFAKA